MTKPYECGNRIKQIRNALGMKQQDFAKRLNVSAPSLSEIETGKFRPSYDLLVSLAVEFNVNIYFVFFGEGDMFIEPGKHYYSQMEDFALNKKDVQEFFYYFVRSPILQYFILSQYKLKMLTEKDFILREAEDFEANTQK